MFFTGRVEHALDGKNRIRLPRRFRDLFPKGEDIYFMQYASGCIAVYSESTLEERLAPLKEIKSDQPILLKAKRKVMSALEKIDEDTQGRITLSRAMREHSGIIKDVVTVGMGDYLEIWSRERFNEKDKVEGEEEYEMDIEKALLKIGV